MLSCQSPHSSMFSYHLVSRHRLLRRDPPDPYLPLLPSQFPPLAHSPCHSLPSAHKAVRKVSYSLWNKKLEFEPSEKELDCMVLVLHAVSTGSRLISEFTTCNRQDHASSPTQEVGHLISQRIMYSVLLRCFMSLGDPRREMPRSICIVTKLPSEGDSNCWRASFYAKWQQ